MSETQRGEKVDSSVGPAEKKAVLPRIRVLVVDDNEVNLMFLKSLFRRIGGAVDYQVETASGGEEAQSRIEAGFEPNAIISDLKMPKGSGLDFYRWLEANRPEWVSRFVLHTSGSMDPEEGEFIDRLEGQGRVMDKLSADDMETTRNRLRTILEKVIS